MQGEYSERSCCITISLLTLRGDRSCGPQRREIGHGARKTALVAAFAKRGGVLHTACASYLKFTESNGSSSMALSAAVVCPLMDAVCHEGTRRGIAMGS